MEEKLKKARAARGWWGAAALVAVLAGAGLLGPSCTDGPRRVELPKPGQVVASFPAPEASLKEEPAQALAQVEPLKIVLQQPTGEIYQAKAINVGFNHPMVEDLEAASELPPPFTLSPPLEGRFQWLDARTASFSPSGEIPTATRFVVKVPAGLKSLNGQSLEEEVQFGFSTPGLKVVRHDPSWYNARLAPQDKLYVQFNLPVDPAQLKAQMSLHATSQKEPLGYSLEAASKDRGGDEVKKGTSFWIKPDKPFESEQSYTLKISDALTPQQGKIGLRGGWSASFRSYGAFKVRQVSCGWGDCTPNKPWFVEFTNPVRTQDIKDCISVRPALKMREQSNSYDSTSVRLEPVDTKPGAQYQITVSGRCKDKLGNSLSRASTHTVQVGHYRPRVTMNRGASFMELPSPDKKLNFPAALKNANQPKINFPVTIRNTPDLNLRMVRLTEESLPRFLQHFESWWSDDTLGRAGIKPDVARPYGTKLKQDEQKTYAINLAEVLGEDRAGVVFLDLQSDSYDKHFGYGGTRYHKSLVQVTDIGLTAKYSPDSCLIWTTSLSKATPLEGIRVAMRTLQGELLWEGKTDKDGLARAPGIKSFQGKEPRLVLATRGTELSYLDREDWDMQVRPYRFGLNYAWDAPSAEVRGHVFTERGVYRPGEEVHIKAYLRVDRGRQLELLPSDQARVRVMNAHGEVALEREVGMTDLDGLHLDVPLDKEAPLGTWSVEVHPVDLQGVEGFARGSFRVEAYRAPDFEVTVQPGAPYAFVGEEAAVTLSGQYLFGAPMSGAKVSWSARRLGASFTPPGMQDYAFGDEAGRFWWYEDQSDHHDSYLGGEQKTLDKSGLLPVSVAVAPQDQLKGPQRVVFEATVTDANRQVVSGQATVQIHPASFYIGLRRQGYLMEAGKKTSVGVVAVSPDNQRLAGQPVKVELQQRQWSSVRKAAAGGGYTWVTETQDTTLATCKVRSGPQEQSCEFEIPTSGYYVVKGSATDKKGRAVETTTSFYAWGGGWSWWGGGDDEKINLVPDKETYKVGQKARIMVQSPFREARALVTVERRGILTQEVIKLVGSANTIEIPVTEEMLPNAYVSVTLIRGRLDKPKDDGQTIDPGKPAFKMGYIELKVDRGSQVLQVEVQPEKERYQPGDQVNAEIVVRDHQGQPVSGELTFMAVDEGVLSLTAYKTPDPVLALFRPQPIAVISAESRRAVVARVDNAEEEDEGEKGEDGGDGGGGASQNFRAAFATTAAFEPLIKVGPEGRAKVSFKLPDNLTAFRLMAVTASSGNRFGSAQARVQVQKPLLVRPSLPRFNSTGDDYTVSAVIQSVGDTAGRVRVEARTTGPVELTGDRVRELELAPGQVTEVGFPASVSEPGEATFQFVATMVEDKKISDAVEIKLPVRFPAATQSWTETGVVQATGKEDRVWKQLALPKDIRPDVGGLDIELSSSAMADLLPGLQYLMDYPYGCVEQTTGSTLPLVAMREVLGDFKLPGFDGDKIGTFAQAGLDRLWTMQTYEGGLGYWPGAEEPHPWGSVYGGLALVMASRSEDFKVDHDKLERLLGYLHEVARGNAEAPRWYDSDALANTRAFAAFVLAEAGQPDESVHTVLFEERGQLSQDSRVLLALAILRGEGDHQMARDLLSELSQEAQVDGSEARLQNTQREHYYWQTMDSPIRTNALMLWALTRGKGDAALTQKFARGLLAERTGGHWLSTQDNAFSALALLYHFDRQEGQAPDYTAVVGLGQEAVLSHRFQGRKFEPQKLHIPMKDLQRHKGDILSLVREGGPGPLYYTLRLRYVDATPPQKPFDNGFTLRRRYIAHDGPHAGQEVKKLKPGQVVKVQLTLVLPTDRHYVAIEDPLPAGLEPINTGFATAAPSLGRDLAQENQGEEDWWYYDNYSFDRIEQRDDRVVLFADFFPQGVYSHTYLARATTPGRYQVPAARAEEMYDPTVFGHTEAFTLDIAQ